MSDKSWEDLVDRIDQAYTIDNSEKLTESIEEHPNLKRNIERIEFEKDNKKFRIERVTSPTIIDKKTHYSHRGVANRIEYQYDPNETSSKVVFYMQLADGHWNEITPEAMMS